MNNFTHCIQSSFYKVLHSRILWLHIIVPVLGISVFGGYFSYSPWGENDKIFGFIQAVIVAFPLMIAIAVSMLDEQEANAGNYHGILAAPYSKIISHIGNFIAISVLGLCASIFTVFGFGIIFHLMGYTAYPITLFLKLSLLVFALNFGVYIIQYMISFAFGKGISLGFGIMGTLLSCLLYYGLADGFWQYIPFGWGIRISAYYLFKVTNPQAFNTVMLDYRAGSLTMIIMTVVFMVCFVIWSKNWQGQRYKSE
ncbi:lantibiotic immunity ABC transporter MutG family permease subunit [Aminipila terrae]|uniref:Lantibiotic immunity ABC transporter MutG family permease subunit n=1 Tax=Aminipila terrae TaxID=2697030 RepID=A0A6P1MEJ8_9FIRM|nr:lantibiotic immunity ABC transporter MutG family permease subunit [Aminipila terrae]QHI72251.1 lantibiotic immunity ABC transporter MutG family permease subunit [Aminipila terrae]